MLKPNLKVPLTEFDCRVFEVGIPQDHYLRRVDQIIDFEAFRPSLANAYHATMGRPAINPVRMLKILFLCFHYKLSDRVVMERIKTDVAFRWFLDLPFGLPVPNHTDGTYFRKRLGEKRYLEVFQKLVAQAREAGLVNDRLRVKDATHLFADVADIKPLQLAGQVRDRLLRAAEPFFPDWASEQRARIEVLRQTTAELPDAERLANRVEFLRELAEQLRVRAAGLPAPKELDPAHKRLQLALRLVEKLLADRDNPGAGDYLFNANDPDARVGKHGEFFVGYLLDMAMDPESELIASINVLPGNGAEAADAVELIRQEEAAQGNDVQGMSIDGIGYNGPVLRELTDPAGLNLEVTVPPPPASTRTTFGPERFSLTIIDEKTREISCPNGQTTRQRRRNEKDTGDRYTFRMRQCIGCPLRGDCLQNPASRRGRHVDKNDYEAEYRKVEEKARSPEYRETRRSHAKVERKLGELVRHHRARNARYRGRPKVLIQAAMTAFVVNVKRMVKLIVQKTEDVAAALTVRAEVGMV